MKTTKAIASSIQLVTLTTGAWRASKLNKSESIKVNSAHNAGDAAKVIVRLTDHPALLALYKLHAEAYSEHKRITLPSIQDGLRIVPTGKQIEHAKIMADFTAKHEVLVNQFMADYPQIRLEAPIKLNGLFDGRKWPADETVRAKFALSVRYLPCPCDGAWSDWLDETAAAGQAELRERLVTAARHLATVLQGDGKLYQSALDNLREVCELAGQGFNLLDDPIISQAARELLPHASNAAANMRDAKAIRADVSTKVTGILATLNLS